jgi:hypothetical protein
MKSRLYIFIEGNDDELFFRNAIVPALSEKYDEIEVIQYAQMKKSKVEIFILSINTLNFDYMLFGDIDYQRSVNQKKKVLELRFSNLDEEKIFIVIQEIESWYMAGITDSYSRELGIRPLGSTNKLVKEEFNLLYHRRFKSRIDFMLEILKSYSIPTAIKKNESFKYFAEKCLL